MRKKQKQFNADSILKLAQQSGVNLPTALRKLELACAGVMFEMADRKVAMAYLTSLRKFHEANCPRSSFEYGGLVRLYTKKVQ